jgi:uncharacterized OsmC-like protein
MRYTAHIQWRNDDYFEVATQPLEQKLSIDRKREDYTPKGPTASELFVASLAGCIGVFAKRYLSRHEVGFKKLEVTAAAELTKETPVRLTNIHVAVSTDAQLGNKRDVFMRFIKNCPIHNTLLHTKEVDISLE